MNIGDNSVPHSKQIVGETLSLIKSYNIFGDKLSNALKESELTVFILDESWCENLGNHGMTQFRGYAKENEIIMFFTRFETIDSMEWLLLHEIGHWALMQSMTSLAFMNIARQEHYKNAGIYRGVSPVFYLEDGFQKKYRRDKVHDADPEEHLANLFADGVLGESYGRPWWRSRIKEVTTANALSSVNGGGS